MPDPKVPCAKCAKPITPKNMARHERRCDGEWDGRGPVGATERLQASIRITDTCWEWIGTINNEGYGTFYRDGKNLKAHRAVYELHVGAVPQGYVIDHVCHNQAASRGECDGGDTCQHRRCVNPQHLEVVTDAENIARGKLGYASRTLCRAGLHDITQPSSWWVGKNGRQCLACYRGTQARRTGRRSEARAAARAVEQEGENDA